MSIAAQPARTEDEYRFRPSWRGPDGRPTNFRVAGVKYLKFLPLLQARLKAERYLEIGTSTGDSVAVMRGRALCVDPLFRIARDVWPGKEQIFLFQQASGDFFARHDPAALLGGPVQLAFIDGMHHYEYALRDFINLERCCAPDAVVVLHDCVPWKFGMTHRLKTLEDGSFEPVTRAWTGDVWRMLPILAELRPDLRFNLLDCPPTGLACITGLDPRSTVLRDALEVCIRRTDAEPDTEDRFWAWLEAQPLVDTRRLVSDAGAFWRMLGLPKR